MNKNNLGVSLYISNIDNISYLEKASQDGVRNIFISLHIAEEVLKDGYKDKVIKAFEIIRKLKFSNVMCDISPLGIKAIGLSINTIDKLKDYGVTTLRLDYGFKPEEVVKIAKKINIAINASQVTKQELEFYKKNKILNKIVASHNFYPLIGSGLSDAQVLAKDSLLRMYGINNIYSFIPGKKSLRKTAEIAYGLPTIENHRSIDRTLSYEILSEEFNHEIIYIGDPDYFKLNKYHSLKIEAIFKNDKYLLGIKKFEVRDSDLFIRLKGTRAHQFSESGVAKGKAITSIKPVKITSLTKGDVVVINSNSQRYLGEVLIVKKDINDIDLSIFNKIGICKLSDQSICQIEKEKTIEFK